MADRQVKVSLVAQVNGYISGMQQAEKSTREVGTAAEKLAQQRQAFEALGRSALIMGAVIAAGVAVAIRKFAEFDQAMSQVNAVTQETTANMALLRDAALDAGGRTVFTATEAANAIEELGKAGISTADILGGALDGALSLAASGQLEVARAAEITATTLKQFGLAGSEAGHVADVLSAGAGKALGSVEDLAQGLKFVGPVAASMGISLEETTGALALFADQGLIGEQAGTSLRGVLSSLTSPSKEAAKEIENLGINLYDSQGGFVSLENLAGQLSNAYSGLDDKTRDASLGILFGNQQVTAARVLFDGGATAVQKYTAEVNDAGYAARVAADRMNNLSGDVEKLGGAFDTALIKTGSGANDVLRQLVQSATFLVDAFGNLPQPILNASLAVGAVAAAVLLAGGAALTAVPKFAAFREAMNATSIGARTATVAVAGIGAAVGVATIVISKFVEMAAEYKGGVDSLAESFDKATGAATDYTRSIQIQTLESKNAIKFAEQMGISAKLVTDAALGNKDAFAQVKKEMQAYYDAETDLVARSQTSIAMGEVAGAIEYANKQLEDAQNQFGRASRASDENADSTKTAADAYKQAADEAKGLDDQLSALIDTINEANGVGQDAVTANIDYQDALRDLGEQIDNINKGVDGYAATLDISTEAGARNYDMLIQAASKGQDAAKAQFDLTHNSEDYYAALVANRDTILQNARDLGATDEQIQYLADHVVALPDQKTIDILANTEYANRTIDDFIAQMGQKIGTIYFRSQLTDLNGVEVSGNGRFGTFATGGYTGDMPATAVAGIVHGREFVNNEVSTAKPANRAAMEFMNAGGDISNFTPAYVAAPVWSPQQMFSSSKSEQNISLDVKTLDPATVAELVLQQVGARVRTR